MLCLGEVLQCGTSQDIQINHKQHFYHNTLVFSLYHSYAKNLFAATLLSATFCFSVMYVPLGVKRHRLVLFYIFWFFTDSLQVKSPVNNRQVKVKLLCEKILKTTKPHTSY